MAGDPPSESEGMSQEDIDAALAGAGGEAASEDAASEPASSVEPAGDIAAGAGDAGSCSQAEIDAALAGETADAPAGEAAAPAPAAEAGTGASSQDDIDALLSGASEGDAGSEAADAGTGASSQDDIDALFAGGADAADETEPAAEAAPLPVTNEDGSPKLDSQGRPFDEAAAMMEAAIAEERAAAAAAASAAPAPAPAPAPAEMPPPPAGAVSLALPELAGATADVDDHGIRLLNDVKLDVKIELGRSMMLIEDVLRLGEGSVVELDKLAGDPVDVFVNERLVARGEVLVLNDNFCVRISDIMPGAQPVAAAS